MLHSLKNINMLELVLTGEDKPNGWILRKLWEFRHDSNSRIIKDTKLVDIVDEVDEVGEQEKQTSDVVPEEVIKKDESE